MPRLIEKLQIPSRSGGTRSIFHIRKASSNLGETNPEEGILMDYMTSEELLKDWSID
jgi:hypothetical protein